ncbi:hypothetical protein GCM10027589_27370 [Actinocorallia lasiicapitis]
MFDPLRYLPDVPQPRAGADHRTLLIRAVLEAMQGPASLLSPVRDEAGRIVDFHVDAVNADARDRPGTRAEDLVGRKLLTSYPGLAMSDLFDAYVQAFESGVPLRRPRREYPSVQRGRVVPTLMSVRACRIGDGLLASWQFHDDSRDLSAQLDQAQRIGDLGWAEWDLSTGGAHWSDQLYVIFGRSPADGPLTLEQVGERIHEEDAVPAESLMRSLLGRREAADVQLRIRRGKGVRHLRVMAEPVLDGSGEPTVLRCLFQDVTKGRRAEQQLQASRRKVEEQRRRLAEERELVVGLQRAVLPRRSASALPGVEAALRYLPAESETQVGGDWYESTELPDGQIFLAIGDVSGHGLPAAEAMASLRNALLGLAFTGASPEVLLGWLNELMLHRQAALTATCVAGRFDPVTRTLVWAQAGHPPPVLVRGGGAVMLEQPDGILLGASDEIAFRSSVTKLEPGDRLLLYTDGLVERRGRDLFTGFELLTKAAAACTGDSLDDWVGLLLDTVGGANPDDDTCLVAVRIR